MKIAKPKEEQVAEPAPLAELNYPIDKRSCKTVGRITNEEKADVDFQKNEMRLIAGSVLRHFRRMVDNKELTFNQELQLFKEVSKYLGYNTDGNKSAEDIGMDTFAMKFLEVNARIKKAEKQSAIKLDTNGLLE